MAGQDTPLCVIKSNPLDEKYPGKPGYFCVHGSSRLNDEKIRRHFHTKSIRS